MLFLPLLASQADASDNLQPAAMPGQPGAEVHEEQKQPDTLWIEWEVQSGRPGRKTAPKCSIQPDKTTTELIIKGACCEETNGSYDVQDERSSGIWREMPRHWTKEYENGSDEKTPEKWKITCDSKPWYQNEAGYYIHYNSTDQRRQRWELRAPYDGMILYHGKPVAFAQIGKRDEVTTSGGCEVPAQAPRTEEVATAPPSFMSDEEAHLRKFAAKPVSQPQLHVPAGKFYLPSTIKVRKPKSFEDWQPTVEVYTSDEGSACPLMGVYDQMNDETSPRSWKLAYEDGNDDASETIWKRKLGNRPWYSLLKEIRGSKRNFYIRKNNERWCLYDNYANDKKGRWIYETPPTNNSNPIGLKWMLHDKCRDCKETGKKHGQDPSSCYDYNYVSNRACTCGLKCKVCDGSGKVWENRIWPF